MSYDPELVRLLRASAFAGRAADADLLAPWCGEEGLFWRAADAIERLCQPRDPPKPLTEAQRIAGALPLPKRDRLELAQVEEHVRSYMPSDPRSFTDEVAAELLKLAQLEYRVRWEFATEAEAAAFQKGVEYCRDGAEARREGCVVLLSDDYWEERT